MTPTRVSSNRFESARRPTMRDVAREASVSIKTVSRVINNDTSVGPDYVDRVVAAVRRLGFRRNELAHNLRAGRSTATIALVIGDLTNPFYAQIAAGIEAVAHSQNTFLVISSSEEDPTRERDLVTTLCQRQIDGLIVVPTAADHSYCRAEIDLGTPMVFLDRRPAGIHADTVVIDNPGGSRSGTNFLLGRGHERISVIGHPINTPTMPERVHGVRGAMKAAGATLDPDLLRLGPLTPHDAETEAAHLLNSTHPPTAFFACNNLMTMGILKELCRHRLDIDVVGFGDVAAAEFFPMEVGLITYDIEELARRAAQLLFERIQGRRTIPNDVVIATQVITKGGALVRP